MRLFYAYLELNLATVDDVEERIAFTLLHDDVSLDQRVACLHHIQRVSHETPRLGLEEGSLLEQGNLGVL